jgi:hypothetical protein
MQELKESAKHALRDGGYGKRWVIDVYDGNNKAFSIDNNNLISESVEIDERLCSGSELKFGLCEGSLLKFKYFDLPDVGGKRLKVTVYVEDLDYNEHAIPLGWFDADSCITQKSTGIKKVVAYNKLKSDYLDSEIDSVFKKLVKEGEEGQSNPSFYYLLTQLMDGYTIERQEDSTNELPRHPRWTQLQITTQSFYKVTSTGQGEAQMGSVRAFYIDYWPPSTPHYVGDYFRVRYNPHAIYEFIKAAADPVVKLPSGEPYYLKPKDSYGYGTWDALFTRDEFKEKIVGLGKVGDSETSEGERFVITDFKDKNEGINLTEWHRDISGVNLKIPIYFKAYTEYGYIPAVTDEEIETARQEAYKLLDLNYIYIDQMTPSTMESKVVTATDIAEWDGLTPRKLQSAVFETECQFGTLDRVTDLFSGHELNGGGLQPRDGLYPATGLYPRGNAEHSYKSMYSALFTDQGGSKKWHKLIITYSAMDGENKVEKTLERTINSDGNVNYNMSDNWLFKNLIWTAEDVGAYADRMVEKMRGITWMPFDMECAGLPYLETGDLLEIETEDGTERSYILERRLKGIQNLEDSISCGTVETF